MTSGTGLDPATLRRALTHVESLPLGEAVVLHNRESGALLATNAFGAMLIAQLRDTPDAAAATRNLAAALDVTATALAEAVTATMARWAEDGLFLTAQRPFPHPVPYRAAEAASGRWLVLGSNAVRLEIEDPRLAEDIDRALAPMDVEGAPRPGTRPVRLEAIRTDPGYGVFRDTAPIWGIAGYELTRFHLLREIMDSLCGPDRISAHLHASAVAKGGAGLVFAGASGSGKSTLATLLLGAGAALASDDHAAIDKDGAALLAFPTRPNLKPGALDLPAIGAVIAGRGDGGGEGQSGFMPRARVPAGTAVRLAGFVFPQYDPEGENALTEIAPDDALRRLIQTGSRVSRRTRSVAPLVRALARGPTFALSYRDTDFAVSTCLRLLAP